MTEQMLDEMIRGQIQEVFKGLQHPVRVLFFGSDSACDYCEDTLNLIQEVASLSDRISISVYDLDKDPQQAAHYRVSLTPTLVIAGEEDGQAVDYGVRFAGIPAGHEFSSFIHVLVMVSARDSALQEKTRQALREIQEPVHLQVFVTPT
jgi:alkyl hydroperoxide reductase subunit AhpF